MLGHMTGLQLLRRLGYDVDVDAILVACAKHGLAVEINANPWRLDQIVSNKVGIRLIPVKVKTGWGKTGKALPPENGFAPTRYSRPNPMSLSHRSTIVCR